MVKILTVIFMVTWSNHNDNSYGPEKGGLYLKTRNVSLSNLQW